MCLREGSLLWRDTWVDLGAAPAREATRRDVSIEREVVEGRFHSPVREKTYAVRKEEDE
jgi:hypothetical protein